MTHQDTYRSKLLAIDEAVSHIQSGNDVIVVEGRTLNISTGAGNDAITVGGLDYDYTDGSGAGSVHGLPLKL